MLHLLITALLAALRPRADLVLENLALRQQLAVLASKGPRPRFSIVDRAFWIGLMGIWSRWADTLILVKPETVIRWHRRGFKALWRWKSRHGRPGRPPVAREIRDLVRRMAAENPTWGAPRIHGELRKLGFPVSERTVSHWMPRRPVPPDALARWKTFLDNHRDAIAAVDFFTVHTVSFAVLYVFFVIHHGRRAILHVNVTAHPTADWVIRQIQEAFPWDTAPRLLLLDRDSTFAPTVLAAIKQMGTKPVRISFRSPWQNGVAERWVLSARQELLDQVVVLGEMHLRRLLKEYLCYYAEDRTHLALGKDTPAGRAASPRPSPNAQVVALPRVGGLHHRYVWRQAA